MGIMDWLHDFFFGAEDDAQPQRASAPAASVARDVPFDIREHVVNPATGLPMIFGPEGVDTAGNPFGFDLQRHDEPTEVFGEHGPNQVMVEPEDDPFEAGGGSWTDDDESDPFGACT